MALEESTMRRVETNAFDSAVAASERNDVAGQRLKARHLPTIVNDAALQTSFGVGIVICSSDVEGAGAGEAGNEELLVQTRREQLNERRRAVEAVEHVRAHAESIG